jgi:hypothetical protein
MLIKILSVLRKPQEKKPEDTLKEPNKENRAMNSLYRSDTASYIAIVEEKARDLPLYLPEQQNAISLDGASDSDLDLAYNLSVFNHTDNQSKKPLIDKKKTPPPGSSDGDKLDSIFNGNASAKVNDDEIFQRKLA